MYISIHDRIKKTFALLAIFAMIGTSVPVGALTAFAQEVTEETSSEVITETEETSSEESTEEGFTEESEETDTDATTATIPAAEEETLETAATSEEHEAVTGFVVDADGIATVSTVALGVTYAAPQNDQVQVTFTQLPETAGTLSIQEVLLTDEQVAQLGALSNVAYDITSTMENGTFAYDLVLPLPEGAEENAQVVFAETAEDLSSGDVESVASAQVDVVTNEQTVAITELDHFTIFVVTSFEEPQVTPPATSYNGVWTALGIGAAVTQALSGTDGITSAEGDNHAVIKTSAYTDWDGRKSEFPEGGYDTRVDVYVDMSLATGQLFTKRMAFSSAINDISGDHQRDFVFHLGTKALSSGKWVVSASDNVIDLPGNPFHSPITLTETGWYTLEHQFRDVGGVLEVTLNIYEKGEAAPVGSWMLSNGSDVIDSTVGGNRYGWFIDTGVLNRFNKIAIDNAEIEYNVHGLTPGVSPTRPTLAGEAIYDAIPSVLPSNFASQGYQATQTFELGDKITFKPDTGRSLLNGAVTLSSWACESGQWDLGTCLTTPGATFNHPITLTLYAVAGDGSVGAPIASRTQTFAIPYRPSADITCEGGRWKDANGDCFNGYNHVVVFDLTGITVPDTVIYGVAYNTQSYGNAPIGVDGPYNSLNVSLNDAAGAPYIGTDVDTNQVFLDSLGGGDFAPDNGWAPYKVAVTFTAVAIPHNSSVVEVNWSQMNGWSAATTGNGVVDFVHATSSQIGDQALSLTTQSDNNDRASIARTENVDLADVTTLKYSTKRSAGFEPAGNASYRVRIDADGDLGTTNDTAYLIHEPYWQNSMSPDPAPNVLDVWQTWDVASGFFWASIPGGNAISGLTNGAGGPPFYTIEDVLTLHPNAKVIGINIGIGSYNMDYDILVDAVVFGYKTDSSFETTTYDFTVDTVPPVTPTGLRYDNNPTIACGGFTNINYTYPKWDVVVDAVSYDYQALFGASVVYSTNFTTNEHPGGTFGGGQNGVWGFQVRSVDASGLKSDWSPICEITLDTVAPAAPVHLSPANNSTQDFNDFYFDWTDVADVVEYEFQSAQDPAVDGNNVLTNGVWNNKAHGGLDQNFLSDSTIHSYGANGTWYWQVRAIDAAGNKSPWTMPWKMTIDLDGPDPVPVSEILSPEVDEVVSGTIELAAFYADENGDDNDAVQWAVRAGTCAANTGTVFGNVDTRNDSFNWNSENFSSMFDTTQVSNGSYCFVFNPTEDAGDENQRLTRTFTVENEIVDTTAPAVPTGLAWTDSENNDVPDNGTTALYAGAASWNQNEESDFDHYIYKYWNDIESSTYRDEATSWTLNMPGVSNTNAPGVFNQGEGVHHFCIVAVDISGNASACSAPFTITYMIDDGGNGNEDLTPITMCKFIAEVGQSGWGMTLSNSGEGEGFTSIPATTDGTGCVTVSIDLADGPWTVVEENRAGYTQDVVYASQGTTLSVGDESDIKMCMFGLPAKTQTDSIVASNEESGYTCNFYNSQNTVVDNEEETDGSSSTATRFGSRSSARPDGEVLGASTSSIEEGDFCAEPYLIDNLGLGKDNDSAQVVRLQNFLNDYLTAGLAVTGVFETSTQQAVMDFQLRYAADILTPWGISNATGFVYHTTKKKINEMVCERDFPLTQEQLDEINRVKNQIAGGITTLGTPQETVAGAETTTNEGTDASDDTSSSSTDTENKADEEEEQGFFGRLWDSIFGG